MLSDGYSKVSLECIAFFTLMNAALFSFLVKEKSDPYPIMIKIFRNMKDVLYYIIFSETPIYTINE